MSLVTVVITAHDQGAFVTQAIESALGQTHPRLEIVVVDDGSTDGTAAATDRFRHHASVAVVRQLRAGLPAARNRGLAESHGEFVCFLDADDFLAPDYVSRLLAPLARDSAPGFSYCDVQIVDRGGRPSSAFSVGESRRTLSGDIVESLLIGGYFPPAAVLVRRRVLDALGGFVVGLDRQADYEMWLRISAAGFGAAYVNERLVCHRVYGRPADRDPESARQTKIEALERIARNYPGRLAAALSAVQDLSVDLHAANVGLRERCEAVRREAEAQKPASTWSLIEHFADAQLIQGTQVGLWNVTIGGATERAVFLYPPATLQAVIPVGFAGQLVTAFAMPPDMWLRPNAEPCGFSITANDIVTGGVLLDAHTRETDRRWVAVAIDVPASDSGEHRIVVDTRAPLGGSYCRALFRDVRFTWSTPVPASS